MFNISLRSSKSVPPKGDADVELQDVQEDEDSAASIDTSAAASAPPTSTNTFIGSLKMPNLGLWLRRSVNEDELSSAVLKICRGDQRDEVRNIVRALRSRQASALGVPPTRIPEFLRMSQAFVDKEGEKQRGAQRRGSRYANPDALAVFDIFARYLQNEPSPKVAEARVLIEIATNYAADKKYVNVLVISKLLGGKAFGTSRDIRKAFAMMDPPRPVLLRGVSDTSLTKVRAALQIKTLVARFDRLAPLFEQMTSYAAFFAALAVLLAASGVEGEPLLEVGISAALTLMARLFTQNPRAEDNAFDVAHAVTQLPGLHTGLYMKLSVTDASAEDLLDLLRGLRERVLRAE